MSTSQRCSGAVLVILTMVRGLAQTPVIFDVSEVTIGPQKIATKWAYAEGKWSDASAKVGVPSASIHCYERFGFCEDAEVITVLGTPAIRTEMFDVLRWDDNEIIAVDSSPVCLVTTLRFDLALKRVTVSSASKHETRFPVCKDVESAATGVAYLTK
jgi:hypothetical protein